MKMHFVPVLFERWETFLIVANHWDGSYHTDSVVFRWNGQQFVVFQKLPKEGAAPQILRDKRRRISRVAGHHGGSTYLTKWVIYKWNDVKFIKSPEIATDGAMGCKAEVQFGVFKLSGVHFVKLNLTGHMTWSLLTSMDTPSSLLPATTHEVLRILIRLSTNGMVPCSLFSNPPLLVEPSLGILS